MHKIKNMAYWKAKADASHKAPTKWLGLAAKGLGMILGAKGRRDAKKDAAQEQLGKGKANIWAG